MGLSFINEYSQFNQMSLNNSSCTSATTAFLNCAAPKIETDLCEPCAAEWKTFDDACATANIKEFHVLELKSWCHKEGGKSCYSEFRTNSTSFTCDPCKSHFSKMIVSANLLDKVNTTYNSSLSPDTVQKCANDFKASSSSILQMATVGVLSLAMY